MPTRDRFALLTVLAIALGLASAACGSKSGSPLGPDSFDGNGAAIDGTVASGSDAGVSSAEVSAFGRGSGLRVTVVGGELSTTTDSNGHFRLAGLQGNHATLRFEGPGVDARLEIRGLVAGQILIVAVQVSGSTAQLMPLGSSTTPPATEPQDEVEFTGVVESVRPPDIVVDGRTVRTDGATEIKRGDSTIRVPDLNVGETVRVEGRAASNGIVLAREIRALSAADTGTKLEFEGLIKSIAPPRLVVAATVVLTDAHTEFKGEGRTHSLADFSVGDLVTVEGTQRSDGSVLASEIHRSSRGGDNDDDDNQGDDNHQGDEDNGGHGGGDDDGQG